MDKVSIGDVLYYVGASDKQKLFKITVNDLRIRLIDDVKHYYIIINGEQIPSNRFYKFKSDIKLNIFGEPVLLSCISECGERVHPERNSSPKSYIGKIPDNAIRLTEEEMVDSWNGAMYEWYIVNRHSKYGQTMYCPKTNKTRSLTMDEFYKGGIVD